MVVLRTRRGLGADRRWVWASGAGAGEHGVGEKRRTGEPEGAGAIGRSCEWNPEWPRDRLTARQSPRRDLWIHEAGPHGDWRFQGWFRVPTAEFASRPEADDLSDFLLGFIARGC